MHAVPCDEQDTRRGATDAGRTASLVSALCELAAVVQRERTVDAVLEAAGRGVRELGMRFVAFQLQGNDLVLRYVATTTERQETIERRIGRELRGLSVPLADFEVVRSVMEERRVIYRHDCQNFARFVHRATGIDLAPHDLGSDSEVGTTVIAPLFVRDEPWGILGVYSDSLTRADGEAVALFAMHVGSALEAAESLEILARTQAELVRRERLAALGELAAVVAHEVRNPLGVLFNAIGSLRGFVDAGAPREKLGDAAAVLSIAAEEAERLNRIVSDLLQFGRPFELTLVTCSLPELVRKVVAETADARVRVDVADDLPAVDLDAGYMQQALLNLLLNALQAVDDAGVVTIRASVEARDGRRYARVDVTDTGPGIPEDVRGSVFEPFFTTKATGTGLGLPIVKRIVDAHSGYVDFECGPDGTTFSVWIPVESVSRSTPSRTDG